MKKETRLIMKQRLEKCIQWYYDWGDTVVVTVFIILGIFMMVQFYTDILPEKFEQTGLFLIVCGITLSSVTLFGFVFLVLKMIFDSLGD